MDIAFFGRYPASPAVVVNLSTDVPHFKEGKP
jgi:hypothetical protein